MTRAPNITPEQIDAMEALLANGLPQKHACAELGLSYNTFRKQLERGAKDIESGEATIFADLSRAVARGRAAKVRKWVEMLQLPNRHGELDGANIRFLLERTEPKDFGTRSHLQIEGKLEHSTDPRESIARKLGLAERGANTGDGAEPEG